MRIQRLRIGLEVLNKINGKRYKVTNINGANGVGTAHEMITDSNGCWSGKFGKDETVITDRNALAFRILNDPEPYPVAEGYSVMNGKLLKNGMPACEAGELIFTGILAVQRDFVILAAKKNGTKEGRAELMSYQVSRDRFTWLYSIPENTTFAGYIGEDHRKAVLVYSSVEEKEQEDKNGSLKKARIFGQAGLMVIMAGMVIHHYETDAPITMEHVMVKEIPDGGGRFTAFLPFDEKEDDNGCLAPRGKRLWLMTDGERQTGTFEADGTLRADWSYIYHSFVIRTQDMILVFDQDIPIISFKNPKVAALEGYDTLIDITKEGYECRMTFSNGNYDFKTLVRRSTRDRGVIVTVE